ncbi:MAG: hypothetical protein ACOY0T_39855 [Myxococcota bacterium]
MTLSKLVFGSRLARAGSTLCWLLAAGCSSLDRFDTKGTEAYCGSLVAAPPFEAGFVPESSRPSLSLALTLDATALTARGEASAVVGRLSSDDAQRGLCAADGLALFNGAPLRTMPELDRDPLSSLEFGSGRDYNFFAWVDSTCQGTLLALLSLMRNDDVELRLLKPKPLPPAGAGPAEQPGFGLFYLARQKSGCGF